MHIMYINGDCCLDEDMLSAQHTQLQLSVGFSSKMGGIFLIRIEALLFWSSLKRNVSVGIENE